jgi:hypothetical protein
MNSDAFKDIEKLETDFWEATDTPVLGTCREQGGISANV